MLIYVRQRLEWRVWSTPRLGPDAFSVGSSCSNPDRRPRLLRIPVRIPVRISAPVEVHHIIPVLIPVLYLGKLPSDLQFLYGDIYRSWPGTRANRLDKPFSRPPMRAI